jgi:Ni/Co efflux regulator RcnB
MHRFICLIIALLSVATQVIAQEARQERRDSNRTTQTSSHRQQRNSNWTHRHNGLERSVTVRDEVRFNADYTDVESLSADGFFQIRETRDGRARQLEITRSAGGALERRYTVDGARREYDAEARDWFARMMVEALRAGFDVEARARQILRERGATGALDEAERMGNSYSARIIMQMALENGGADREVLRRALRLATRQLASSDYEMAELLLRAARFDLRERNVRTVFAEAVGTIESDYERGRVLKTVLERQGTNEDVILFALEAARSIESDYEKANVLISAARLNSANERVRSALIEMTQTISSDYERGRVLAVVYGRSNRS